MGFEQNRSRKVTKTRFGEMYRHSKNHLSPHAEAQLWCSFGVGTNRDDFSIADVKFDDDNPSCGSREMDFWRILAAKNRIFGHPVDHFRTRVTRGKTAAVLSPHGVLCSTKGGCTAYHRVFRTRDDFLIHDVKFCDNRFVDRVRWIFNVF